MRIRSWPGLVGFASRVALAGLLSISFSGLALSKDKEDSDDSSAKAAWSPNIYLDLRTTYATVPADTLSIGLGNPSLSARFPSLATLSKSYLAYIPPNAAGAADPVFAGKPKYLGRRSLHGGP